MTQAHIKLLEKKLGEMELRLTTGMSGTSGASILEAVADRLSVGKEIACGEGTISKTDGKR